MKTFIYSFFYYHVNFTLKNKHKTSHKFFLDKDSKIEQTNSNSENRSFNRGISVKVWRNNVITDMNGREHSLKKTQQNQGACHNLKSHLACQYMKMCILIKHIICESLIKI